MIVIFLVTFLCIFSSSFFCLFGVVGFGRFLGEFFVGLFWFGLVFCLFGAVFLKIRS